MKAAGPVICGRRQQPAINQMVQRALRSPSVSEATRRFPLLLGKCSSLFPTETGGPVTDLLEVDKIRTMVMATVIEVMMMVMIMIMMMMMVMVTMMIVIMMMRIIMIIL